MTKLVSKIGDRKITITPRTLQDNERHCEKCGGTGWLYVENGGEKYIKKCSECDNGVIHICHECGNVTGRSTYCTSEICRLKRESESEARRFEKANKR